MPATKLRNAAQALIQALVNVGFPDGNLAVQNAGASTLSP